MVKTATSCLFILLVAPMVFGSPNSDSPQWKLSGQLAFHSQWYSMDSDTDPPIAPRQPGDLHRVMFTPTLRYGDFRLPVRVIFSSRQTNSVSMRASHQTFDQFIRNPVNTFSVAPSYKWARAVLGSQVVSYSSLTTGDARLFGAAIELTPGKWHLAAFHGTSQRVIQPDSLLRIPGAFQRNFTAVKMGYGRENHFHLYTNLAVMNDDQGSLTDLHHNIKPQEGMAVSLAFGIPLGISLQWKSEAAVSFFSRNKDAPDYSPDMPGIGGLLSGFYAPNLSSRSDYAFQTELRYSRSAFDLNMKGVYVGDGFFAPGFPYLQTDRLDLTLNPRVRIFNSRMILSATVGHRQNNLSNTKLQSTSQLLLGVNANMRFSAYAGLQAAYTNFGMRTGFAHDTLRLEMISSSASVSPWINLPTETGTHQLSSSFTFNNSDDTNLLTGEQVSRQTLSTLLHHSFTFSTRPLGTDFSISYLSNNAQWGISVFTIQPGIIYRFFNQKLHTSLRIAYVNNQLTGFTADRALMIRPGLRYTIGRQWVARADGSIRLYRYGSSRDGQGFTENIMRTSVTYRF